MSSADLPPDSLAIPRIFDVAGRQIEICLEPAVWEGLEEISQREHQPMEQLIASLEAGRSISALEQALWQHVADYFRAAASASGRVPRGMSDSAAEEAAAASPLVQALKAVPPGR